MVEGNNLLAALRPTDLALLEPHFSVVTLENEFMLYEPGESVHFAYFPRWSAVASYLVLLEDGTGVETAMIGNEGAVGGIVSQGQLPAYARCAVLHEGSFYKIGNAELEAVKEKSLRIRHLFARYADCVMAQIFQAVACNASHTIEQRAAKWLSAAVDRTGMTYIAMTQEQLASMMGIGRSYASRVLQRLKRDGLLRTRRGGIEVIDPERLAGRACSCNGLVNRHFETVLGAVYML